MGIKRMVVAGILLTNLIIPANAIEINSSTVPVTLDAETARFSVTVPTSLPVWVDADGGVTVADNAKIVNNSLGPVKVKGVSIQGLNGWSLLDYSQDTKGLPVDSKQAGFILNGDQTTSSSLVFNYENWTVIPSNGEQPLIYNSNIAPQSKAIKEEIAQVIFTVGWDLVSEATEFQVTATNRHLIGYTGKPNENLTIPDRFTGEDGVRYKVTSIGIGAFRNCSNLESVTIPDGVIGIDRFAFSGCDSLQTANLPNGLVEINDGAFYNCPNLTEAYIPNSVKHLGTACFQDTGITNVKIPDGLEKIGGQAFWGCKSLTGSITIPSGIKSIGDGMFLDTGITSIELPDGLEVIGAAAFQGCKGLTSVHLPGSIKYIQDNAFLYCSNLKDINIPEQATQLGYQAFSGCTSISRLDIPNTVASIGENAFKNVPKVYYSGTATGSPWGALSMN